MNTINKIPTVVGELESTTSANAHVYLMSDGTKQTVYTAATNTNDGIMTLSNMENDDFALLFYSPQDTIAFGVYGIGRTEDFDVDNNYTHFCQGFQIKFNIPSTPRGVKLKKAELRLFQERYTIFEDQFDVTVIKKGKYDNDYYVTSFTATADTTEHVIDISRAIEHAWKNGETSITLDFSGLTYIKGMLGIYGEITEYLPTLTLSYEHSYSTENTAQSLSTVVTPHLKETHDLYTGHMVLEHSDFEWSGELMPISLRHIYDGTLRDLPYTKNNLIELNVADFSAMKLGLGWKLDIMQSMAHKNLYIDNVLCSAYIYTDGNGNETYFIPSVGDVTKYYSLDDESVIYDSLNKIINWGNLEYTFENERLVKLQDTERNISVNVVYATAETEGYAEGQLVSVSDGANREFNFAYNSNGYLTSITAPDNSKIIYNYTNEKLNCITRFGSVKNENGEYSLCEDFCEKIRLSYTDELLSELLISYKTNDIYKKQIMYTYTSDGKIQSIQEKYDVLDEQTYTEGITTNYKYDLSNNKVTVTEISPETVDDVTNYLVKSTVYNFDDEGNIEDEYTVDFDYDTLIAQGTTYLTSPFSADGAALIPASENYLPNHTFVTCSDWVFASATNTTISSNCISNDENHAMYGRNSLILSSSDSENEADGYYCEVSGLEAGEYTFSAYVDISRKFEYTGKYGKLTGVYLEAMGADGTLGRSETVCEYDTNFAKISTTFTYSGSEALTLAILYNGAGEAYVSAPSLMKDNENGEYNHIENIPYVSGTGFNSNKSIVAGNHENSVGNGEYFTIYPKSFASVKENFTISAWSKCVNPSDVSFYGIKATVTYGNPLYRQEDRYVNFSCTGGTWEKRSLTFEKDELDIIDRIVISFEYSASGGYALFDNISLVCNSIERNLTEEDFVVSGDVSDNEQFTERSDEGEILDFDENKDGFGNIITETLFEDGCFGTFYRSFAYSENGNDKIAETDTRGNITTYAVDDKNSRITSVTDRCGNITEYEYDKNGNVSKVTRKDSSGNVCSTVDYTHDSNGNVTNITRGDGKEFDFEYNTQGLLTNAAGMVEYNYRVNSGRLKSMTYSNGSKVTLTYDAQGRVKSEKWTDNNECVEAHYRYVYDKSGTLTRSIDFLNQKEYTYTYDKGVLARVNENRIVVENEAITDREYLNSIRFFYNKDGQLRKKEYTSSGLKVYYRHNENADTSVKYLYGNTLAELHTETDHLGRLKTEEVRTGNCLHYRTFEYVKGEITDEHKPEYDADGNLVRKGKIVSNPTTNLVSAISLSNRTLTYGYDAEERITYHKDYRAYANTYTYDAQGQLTSHTVEDDTTYYEYDSYGNILAKGPIRGTDGKLDRESTQNCFYTYTDHDKLVSYTDGTNTYSFAYDTLGNPTTYKGKTLVWEKGRQLKSYGTVASYTYNANGIRTSRTLADGTVYNYELEGSKIVKVTCGENILVPLYDNNDSPVGIIHNGKFYWYAKNLQGDVLAIRDETDYDVVRYNYDAWGKVQINRDYSGCNLALLNPFLYRGYVYDYETKLYYLNSRYYDPEIGRWLNSDDVDYLGLGGIISNNLFVYCENNAVNNSDPDGYAPFLGWGVQLEGSFMGISGGIELVWYKSIAKSLYGNRNLPCVYGYGGFSYNFKGGNVWNIKSLIKYVKDTALRAFGSAKKAAWKIGGSLSLCAFLVYGTINHPQKYTGPFITTGATLFHIKAYYSRSPKGDVYCWGLGISSSKFGFSPLSVSGYAMVPANVIISIANWFSSLFGKIKAITNLI